MKKYIFLQPPEKVKRLKVSTFIYRHLLGNPGQQWFTIEVATDRQWPIE